MTEVPQSYVDSMPCDPTLLVPLGQVTWAAARLHSGVRDAINHFTGASSDEPFKGPLGAAITHLRELADQNNAVEVVRWVDDIGRPAKDERNKVVHAMTYTAGDGAQAIQTHDRTAPGRFLQPELREVTRRLIEASATLSTLLKTVRGALSNPSSNTTD